MGGGVPVVQANACSPIRVKHDDGKAQELRRQAKGIGNGTIHHLNTTDLSFLERKPSFYLPGQKITGLGVPIPPLAM